MPGNGGTGHLTDESREYYEVFTTQLSNCLNSGGLASGCGLSYTTVPDDPATNRHYQDTLQRGGTLLMEYTERVDSAMISILLHTLVPGAGHTSHFRGKIHPAHLSYSSWLDHKLRTFHTRSRFQLF